MGQEFVVFKYMYRDAGNFKTFGRLLLTGQDVAAGAAIRKCLEWGNQFVAEQISIPVLCEEHWASVGEGPSDLDHAFHEFIGLRAAGAEDLTLPVWNSLSALLERMRRAAHRWDVTLSPNCDL